MWASLHSHSYYSIQDGLSSPIQIIERCVNNNIPAFALTDHGNMSGAIPFLKARKKYIEKVNNNIEKATDDQVKEILLQKIEKAKALKLILGCEIYIGHEKQNSHLVVLAKNLKGWQSLIKIVSDASKPENFYRKPRLTLDQLAGYVDGNLIAFSGHMGSDLANVMFNDLKGIYKASTYDEAKTFVKDSWKDDLNALVDQYVGIFGKDNFFYEIQNGDQERLPVTQIVAKTLRWHSKQTGIRCVATADPHYVNKEDYKDHWVVLCNNLGTTIPKVQKSLENEEEVGLSGFFQSDKYYIPTPKEMADLHTESELKTSLEIAESIEDFNIFRKPMMPLVECPDGLTANEYLRQCCREGWKTKVKDKIPKEQHGIYAERIKKELGVLEKADLAGYFLTLREIVNYIKSNGYYVGVGRGSVGGSLASHLAGITALDPILYDLIFERFYNEGRNTVDRISMPDIDLDVQASFRDEVIESVKRKFGHYNVAQIGTFGRMMGRECLKNVLRVREVCSPKDMDRITKFIPDEAAIADELQEMKEEDEDDGASIIRWTLENNKKELRDWCWLDDNGKCQGPYAKYFEQAMRLEGVYTKVGQHAAGVVITPVPTTEIFPVRYDRKTGAVIIDMDMHSVEDMGGLKMDILGVKELDTFYDCDKDIRELVISE